MNQFTKTFLTFIILAGLLFGLYFFAGWFSRTTGYALGEDEKIVLAQCLDGKGAKFYVSETCPLCDAQKKLFGETAMKFIDVAVCENPDSCAEGGVPSWEISGNNYYGFKNFNELESISGCKIQ